MAELSCTASCCWIVLVGRPSKNSGVQTEAGPLGRKEPNCACNSTEQPRPPQSDPMMPVGANSQTNHHPEHTMMTSRATMPMHYSWKCLLGHVDCQKPAKTWVQATAIKKSKQRAENFTVFACDVTKPEDQQRLSEYIAAEQDSIVHAHCDPSCGTCSRAREIKVPGLAPKQQPRPLRTTSIQMGFPASRIRSYKESPQQMKAT